MPAASTKSALKDKLEDDVLDLSLMQMDEVVVEELALLPKGTTIDLSNNLLTRLPENFPTLTHIIKLDLGKNRLEELPEYFGQLKNLRQLDLYSNQIQRLPVSFCQLKNLKWLDLKNNPLVPALQQAAGPCITTSDCATCAKKVVGLMKDMQAQLEQERQRMVIEERKREERKRLAEERERERVKAEKKALKAKKKQEQKANKDTQGVAGGAAGNTSLASDGAYRRNQGHFNGSNANGAGGDGYGFGNRNNASANMRHSAMNNRQFQQNGGSHFGGWVWTLFLVLASLALFAFGAAIATFWIYTGGHFDEPSLYRAIPLIQRDFDAMMTKLEGRFDEFSRSFLQPLGRRMSEGLQWLGSELDRRHKLVAYYLNENVGPALCAAKKQMYLHLESLRLHSHRLWESSRPYVKDLQVQCANYAQLSKVYLLQAYDFACHQATHVADHLRTTLDQFVN